MLFSSPDDDEKVQYEKKLFKTPEYFSSIFTGKSFFMFYILRQTKLQQILKKNK